MTKSVNKRRRHNTYKKGLRKSKRYFVAKGKLSKKTPRTVNPVDVLHPTEIDRLILKYSSPPRDLEASRDLEAEYSKETGRKLKADLDNIVFEPKLALLGETLYDQADSKLEWWVRGNYGDNVGEKFNMGSMFIRKRPTIRSNYIT
jgi:hypothetical protein